MTPLGGRAEGAAAGALRHTTGHLPPFGAAVTPGQEARLAEIRRRGVAVHCVDGVWRAEVPPADEPPHSERILAGPGLDELLARLREVLPPQDSG